MGRRIITVPFDVEPKERDPYLKQKLIAEAAGIFAWVFTMSDVEMLAALDSHGSVTSSAAASIEHALERDPVVRFLLEEYADGVDRIAARDLFKAWCSWCAEVRHESGSETTFGKLVKKVLVGVGDDAQGVQARRLKAGKVYGITPMQDFPLSAYFGCAQFNPAPKPESTPNHSPSDVSDDSLSDQGVYRVHSSLLKKIDKEKDIEIKANTPKETLCPPEPDTPCTHPADRFTESSWALDSGSFVPHPTGSQPVRFDGVNGSHLIGKIAGPSPDQDLLIVRTPSGKVIGCSRKDCTAD